AAQKPHHGEDQPLVRGDRDSCESDRKCAGRPDRCPQSHLQRRLLPSAARQGAEKEEQARLLRDEVADRDRHPVLAASLTVPRSFHRSRIARASPDGQVLANNLTLSTNWPECGSCTRRPASTKRARRAPPRRISQRASK